MQYIFDRVVDGFYLVYNITKNKTLEFQFSKRSCKLFGLDISFSTKANHAGFRFNLCLLKSIEIDFCIVDNRHWDYFNDKWKE